MTKVIMMAGLVLVLMSTLLFSPTVVTPVKAQEPIQLECNFVRDACDVARSANYGTCRLTRDAVWCYFWAYGEYTKCVWGAGCALTD
jgi:hypothetical protein